MDSSARKQIDEWRAETTERPLQSARHVQDRLLDLYDALRPYPVITQLESWLSLTRERQLFDEREIAGFLDELEQGLKPEEAARS